MPKWTLENLIRKYKFECEYFIETGTHFGGGIDSALKVGFEKYYSVEMSKDRYTYCSDKYKDLDNVFLFNSDSTSWLKSLIDSVDKRSVFWLDAHGEGGGAPVLEELDIISKNSIKNHTIIIDDIPIYYGDGSVVKQKCLEINKNYNVLLTPNETREDYILVAWV